MSILETILRVALLILVVLAIFNVIIFVHELGHFLAAKWRGLQIDRFQIWFGKPLWKKTINGVQYGLGWIPAGGFVALPQLAPMEAIEGKDTREHPLPPIKPIDKIIVAVAGPLFSMLLALVCAVIVWAVGTPADFIRSTEIGYVEKDSPAEKAGLKIGDRIVAINGKPVDGFAGSLDSVTERIILSEGKDIVFTVERPGVPTPIELHSGWAADKTAWYQRSGLRHVGVAPVSDAIIGKIYPHGPAEKAGLKPGDRIVEIDGVKLRSFYQLSGYLKEHHWKTISLTVERGDESLRVEITPERPIKPAGNDPMLGILWGASNTVDTGIIHPGPIKQIRKSLRMMLVTITKVISPKSSIGVDQLAGPIGIAKMKYHLLQMKDGWRRVLAFMVLFNVNLAVLNMLPFPVLDGGHITLAVLEAIARRPVKARFLEVLQMGFAIALISLMLYVSSKDIGDDIGRGGDKLPEIEFAP
jgi:regulator of sigma E protease